MFNPFGNHDNHNNHNHNGYYDNNQGHMPGTGYGATTHLPGMGGYGSTYNPGMGEYGSGHTPGMGGYGSQGYGSTGHGSGYNHHSDGGFMNHFGGHKKSHRHRRHYDDGHSSGSDSD